MAFERDRGWCAPWLYLYSVLQSSEDAYRISPSCRIMLVAGCWMSCALSLQMWCDVSSRARIQRYDDAIDFTWFLSDKIKATTPTEWTRSLAIIHDSMQSTNQTTMYSTGCCAILQQIIVLTMMAESSLKHFFLLAMLNKTTSTGQSNKHTIKNPDSSGWIETEAILFFSYYYFKLYLLTVLSAGYFIGIIRTDLILRCVEYKSRSIVIKKLHTVI